MTLKPKDSYVPFMGTYILISLDLEATLNFYCDGVDEIARLEIQECHFKTYPGYCERVSSFSFSCQYRMLMKTIDLGFSLA